MIRALPGGLAVGALALVAAGCGSSASHSSAQATTASVAASPSCLPSTLNHSAKLAGTPVDVSPAPDTDTANPATQISFLGAPASQIHSVSATGTSSGSHSGRLRGYSQGDGASFVPDKPFAPGEQVSVHAVIGTTPVAYRFRIDTPFPTSGQPEFANPQAAPADYQSFYTLPGMQAPTLSVTVPDRDPGAGDIFTTDGPGPGRYGAAIYTPQGRLVWFDQLSGGLVAEDLNVQTYEGQRDLTVWQGKVLTLGFGQGEDVIMNSSYKPVAKVTGGNGLEADLHEFQIAPNDIAYITAFNPILCNLQSIGGEPGGAIIDNAIEAIDMRTGLVRWEWHSLDHVGTDESQFSAPHNDRPWDWFHLNSIDPQPDGNVLISARNTWGAYELQGGSGTIVWRLGGTKSSFTMGPGTTTAWQHDARMLANGEISLFDDGSNPPVHTQARAIVITLDYTHHTATLTKTYTHPSPPLLTASQGNMQTLSSGNVVVDYGGVPAVSEYATDGSLLFDASLPFDMASYRGYRYPWSATPQTPPAVVASANNTNEETIIHASWNGATGVASWRVLAGRSRASLHTQTTVGADDFETSTILPKRYAYVAVKALDSAGHVIGSSHSVAVESYDASLPNQGHAG